MMKIVYSKTYNVYFALGRDFSLKVLNRDFKETSRVDSDMRSILHLVFNNVRNELITSGVGGVRVWDYRQMAGQQWSSLKSMANYHLCLKSELVDIGENWVKKVVIEPVLQHIYCCADTDLHVYNMDGQHILSLEMAHALSITDCVYSPTARVLLTSSVDTNVKAWSLTGGLIHTFRGHSKEVTNIVVHPEYSDLFITSSLDGTVRMWSLDIMTCIYSIMVSSDGIRSMGLTDDHLLYVCSPRCISLYDINTVATYWAMSRNPMLSLKCVKAVDKSTRLVGLGEDNSVRVFSRKTRKNLSTVLPPPNMSPLQRIRDFAYSRVSHFLYILINTKHLWIYTTKTDPACRLHTVNLMAIQDMIIAEFKSNENNKEKSISQSSKAHGIKVATTRATMSGLGNEIVADTLCIATLDGPVIFSTPVGLCCPLVEQFLLLGLEDGRILFMDALNSAKKFFQLKVAKEPVVWIHVDVEHHRLLTRTFNILTTTYQIWSLPDLGLLYEIPVDVDVTDCAILDDRLVTAHLSGSVKVHYLSAIELTDVQLYRQKLEDEAIFKKNNPHLKRKYEHSDSVLSVDVCQEGRLIVTASADQSVKVWDSNKTLITEIILNDTLTSACFLNAKGDVLIGFQNNVFFIHHSKVCPQWVCTDLDEDSDAESEIYEDPAVKFEGVQDDPEPLTLDSYLVPYSLKKVEPTRSKPEAKEEEVDQFEEQSVYGSELSFAETDIYLSELGSSEDLRNVDLTLRADVTGRDLTDTPYYEKKYANQSVSEAHGETDAGLIFDLPKFGVSPGATPSVSESSTPIMSSPPSALISEFAESDVEEDEEIGGTATSSLNKDISKPNKVVTSQEKDKIKMVTGRFANISIDVEEVRKLSNTSMKGKTLKKQILVKDSDESVQKEMTRPVIKKKEFSGDRRKPRQRQVHSASIAEVLPEEMSLKTRNREDNVTGFTGQKKSKPKSHDESFRSPQSGKPAQIQRSHYKENQAKKYVTNIKMKTHKGRASPQAGIKKKREGIGNQRKMIKVHQPLNKNTVGDQGLGSRDKVMELKANENGKSALGTSYNKEITSTGSKFIFSESKNKETKYEADEPQSFSPALLTPPEQCRIGMPVELTEQALPPSEPLIRKVINMENKPTSSKVSNLPIDKRSAHFTPDAERERVKTPYSDVESDWTITENNEQLSELKVAEDPEIQISQKDYLPEYGTRPSTGHSGWARPNTPADGLPQTRRPHTAYDVPIHRMSKGELERRFVVALEKFKSSLGTSGYECNYHRNEGLDNGVNWQDREIQRHFLLKMQKEIRCMSAKERRNQMTIEESKKLQTKAYHSNCTKEKEMKAPRDTRFDHMMRHQRSQSSMSHYRVASHSVLNSRPTTAMSRPMTSMSRSEEAVLIQKMAHNASLQNQDRAQTPFRLQVTHDENISARALSRPNTAVASQVLDESKSGNPKPPIVDTRYIDPRNDAARALLFSPTKSIPSKCSRYMLVTQGSANNSIVPTTMEIQLIHERFPKIRHRWIGDIPCPKPGKENDDAFEFLLLA